MVPINKSSEVLYGIFDGGKSKAPVGDLLQLIEELLIISTNKNYKNIQLCLLGDQFGLEQLKNERLSENDWAVLNSVTHEFSSNPWLLPTIFGFFDSCMIFKNLNSLEQFLETKNEAWLKPVWVAGNEITF